VYVCDAIVSVPLRGDVVGFAPIENATGPLAVPDVAPVTVIQESLLRADHGQPFCVVTFVEPVEAVAGADCDVAESENVQPAGACVTVNVCPATLNVPIRCVPLGFADALKLTGPLPSPFAPLVIVNHVDALLKAFHVHPCGAVTLVDPVPPPASTACPVGLIEKVQDAATWLTVNV
jgi:hypothetical protein